MWTGAVFQDAPASPCPECLHLCDWTLLARDTNTCAAAAFALQSMEYSDQIQLRYRRNYRVHCTVAMRNYISSRKHT